MMPLPPAPFLSLVMLYITKIITDLIAFGMLPLVLFFFLSKWRLPEVCASAMILYYTISEGIVQRPSFNITADFIYKFSCGYEYAALTDEQMAAACELL